MRYLILCLLLTTLPLAAQEHGEILFQKHCQTCHGQQGRGDGPAAAALDPAPRDLTRRPYRFGCGPGAIVHTLRTGIEGSGMPSFDKILTRDEMWALAGYVRSLQDSCGCCKH